MKTLAEEARAGGHGDKIMASGGDPGRPSYIRSRTKGRDTFNTNFRVEPGRIDLSPELVAWAAGHAPAGAVMVEPHIKGKHSSDNKAWPWDRWQALVDAAPPFRLIQCAPAGRKALAGVEVIETPSFWHAVAVLAQSRGIVTTEGGLHHAAGALGKPAVVLFSAFNLPSMFGYASHVNINHPDPDGLGQRRSHPACRRSMERIAVADVLSAMETAFAASA